MIWEKVEEERRIYAENVGLLYPAGADGDLLNIFYTNPIIGYPPVLDQSWHDTLNVCFEGECWREIWTYEITAVDTTVTYESLIYGNCYQVTGTNDVTRQYTVDYFAPDTGMVAFFESYSGLEGYLVEGTILGNETKDGYTFSRDCLPTKIGNEWTYVILGETSQYANSYKIVE
jgi:hypothetical protein